MIHCDTDTFSFHLRTENTSYILAINETGHPLGIYYGRKLKTDIPGKNLLPPPHLAHANQTNYSKDSPMSVLEATRLEYSGPGKGGYRDPSCMIVSVLGVCLILSYSPIPDCDVVCRNVRFVNDSDTSFVLEKVTGSGSGTKLFRRRPEWSEQELSEADSESDNSTELVNNWEATYLSFTDKKLPALAGDAAAAGIELVVPDDGWFGKRDTDDCSLGDWFAHSKKLPGGLVHLADKIRSKGLDFGIWVEPEMTSVRLYSCTPG